MTTNHTPTLTPYEMLGETVRRASAHDALTVRVAELEAALQTAGMIADGDEPDGFHCTNGADRLEHIVRVTRAALAKGAA